MKCYFSRYKRFMRSYKAEGGWGGGALCFQVFDPLVLFNDIHVRPTNPKICLKASPAPIYIKFEGKRAEKTQFFCQNFPKNAQKLLFDQFFFQKIYLRRKT